ncbi:MAG: nitrogen regulation protein NR(II) [Geminicoccaceae bacterium]
MTELPRPIASVEEPSPALVLSALSSPVLVVGFGLNVVFVNPAAEALLGASAPIVRGRRIDDLLAFGSHLTALLVQVAQSHQSLSDYGVDLTTAKGEVRAVDVHVTPVGDPPNHVAAVLHPCSVARQMDRQWASRASARSVAQLAMTLAHEVKNPLSGIRGAAQLLEPNLGEEDRSLARLIYEEIDRIVGLVDRMEMFADERSLTPKPVNVHLVLEHVRRLAENGFGRHVRIVERYDPSLPPVAADRDRLVQLLLNLVKNACEAVPRRGGEVRLVTQYQQGMRIGSANTSDRIELPITIEVWDNGPGVPADLADNLFDPFVSTKGQGTGLGLSLVAKIVGDHGGTVNHENHGKGTLFRVRLPAFRTAKGAANGA